jgi:hypothetical protein
MPSFIPRDEYSRDIVRIFDKIEEHQVQISDKLTSIVTTQTEIKTRFEMTKIPVQPCKEITEHIKSHKAFLKPFVTGGIGACFCLFVKWAWSKIGVSQ